MYVVSNVFLLPSTNTSFLNTNEILASYPGHTMFPFLPAADVHNHSEDMSQTLSAVLLVEGSSSVVVDLFDSEQGV